MPSILSRLGPAAALATAALAVAGPATAAADSLAYIDDGDVFEARPDGGELRRINRNPSQDPASYRWVSQADDGTLVVAYDESRDNVRVAGLRRLGRDGANLGEIQTLATSANFTGPFQPSISPDGRRLAYTFTWRKVAAADDCPFVEPTACSAGQSHSGIAFSDVATGARLDGMTAVLGYTDTSWTDASTLLVSGLEKNGTGKDVLVAHPDADTTAAWFSDHTFGLAPVRRAELSRQRDLLVTTAGPASERLNVYRAASGPLGGAAPVLCATLDAGPGDDVRSPSFSPDGNHIILSHVKGFRLLDVTALHGSGPCPGAVTATDVPWSHGGMSTVDWGPSDPTGAPAGGGNPGGDPGSGDPAGGGTGGGGDTPRSDPPAGVPAPVPVPAYPTTPPKDRLKARVGAGGLKAAVRKGLVLSLTGLPKGRSVVRLGYGGKVVGQAAASS
jgi:hypothetical protein